MLHILNIFTELVYGSLNWKWIFLCGIPSHKILDPAGWQSWDGCYLYGDWWLAGALKCDLAQQERPSSRDDHDWPGLIAARRLPCRQECLLAAKTEREIRNTRSNAIFGDVLLLPAHRLSCHPQPHGSWWRCICVGGTVPIEWPIQAAWWRHALLQSSSRWRSVRTQEWCIKKPELMENGRTALTMVWGVKLTQELKICEWLKVEGMKVEEKCTLWGSIC